MNKFLITALAILIVGFAGAQPKYWVSFADKEAATKENYISEAAIRNRQKLSLPLRQYTDLPLKKEYLYGLKQLGVQTILTSRWSNA